MTQSLFAPPPPPRPAGLPGCDLSSIQNPAHCDYAAMSVRWAMVRVTEGDTPDHAAPLHRAGLQATGAAVGSYAFGRPRHEALAMADLALRQLDGAHWEINLGLDLESEDEEDYLEPAALEAWCVAFLERVEAVTGRRPLVYTGPGWVAKCLPARHSLGKYPLWCADYNRRMTLPHGWTSAVGWQFSGNASIPGYPGPADASVLLVPLDDMLIRGTQCSVDMDGSSA